MHSIFRSDNRTVICRSSKDPLDQEGFNALLPALKSALKSMDKTLDEKAGTIIEL